MRTRQSLQTGRLVPHLPEQNPYPSPEGLDGNKRLFPKSSTLGRRLSPHKLRNHTRIEDPAVEPHNIEQRQDTDPTEHNMP